MPNALKAVLFLAIVACVGLGGCAPKLEPTGQTLTYQPTSITVRDAQTDEVIEATIMAPQ
jgi:hypothetical protein